MLEVNRKILKEKNVLDVIEHCEEDEKVKIENGKLFYDGIELDEDMQLVEDKVTSTDTIFLHGFGIGNTLRKLREKFPKTVIVVFETNPCIIKKALSERDFSKILDKRTIPVILDKDKTEDIIRDLIKILEQRLEWGEIVQFTTPGYRDAEFYNYEEIKGLLKKHIIPIIVNRNTLIKESRRIFENIVKNIPNMAKGGSTEHFLDAFKGKPAVVVASGPSLSKNVDYLKDARDKAIIIAADSVLSVLDEKGIEPDFVCGVDYQEINQMKYTPLLKKKQKSSFIYVASDGVNYSIPKIFNRSFFELSSGFLAKLYKSLFRERKKKHFSINAVTHLAIQLAYIMGCNPIIFIGQDWAFSGGEEHAKGSSVDGGLPTNVIWVKGNYEKKVPTDSNLYSGLKLVEDIIRATKKEGFTYINATEGGAYIEGTEVMAFKDVIDKYMKAPLNKGFLHVEIRPKYDWAIEKTRFISSRLAEIVKKATKALSIDNRVLKKWVRNKNVNEIKDDVDKVNKMNDEITFDEVFSSIVPNCFFKEFYNFHREEIDIEGQDTKKRIEQSIRYFTLIKEKTVEAKKYIDELLDFLKLEKGYVNNTEKFLKNKEKTFKLAELYYRFKDLYTGIKFIDEAIKVYPDDASLYYWKAKYCTLNRFMHKEALENFEKALELDPDFEKARFDYEVEKKMVQSHMILAKQAAERHDYISAKRLIDRALDYEPENEELKKWKDVIEELAKAHKNVQRQNLLFEQLKLEGDVFDEYKEAIEFVRKEQFDEAYEKLKKLYDKYGSFGDIPFLLGSISIDKGKLDDAEKYLNEAVELIPYQPLVYLALGKLYLTKEDYIKARDDLEKAIQMNPDLKPGVLDTLGNLYYEFGEYEKAFRAFEEFLQYSDDKIKTLTKIALCYKEMNMIEEYNKLMNKIKEIAGSN